MSAGVRPSVDNPESKLDSPLVLYTFLSRSESVSPSPTSKIIFFPCAVNTNRFAAMGTRLFSSAGSSLFHMLFGTTPNIRPPSSRKCDSTKVSISNCPNLIRRSILPSDHVAGDHETLNLRGSLVDLQHALVTI